MSEPQGRGTYRRDSNCKSPCPEEKRTIDELAKNLPVEEIVIDLPESSLICDRCGGTFKLIGKKLIRRELIIIPQSEKILEYYNCTYACDKCEKDTGFAYIVTTKTQPRLIKHSLASPSTVAADETVVQVLKEDSKPTTSESRMWREYSKSIPGQIPGSRGTGEADALAPGSAAQGTYTEMNERQDPTNGPLP